jgi:hypothetical protein
MAPRPVAPVPVPVPVPVPSLHPLRPHPPSPRPPTRRPTTTRQGTALWGTGRWRTAPRRTAPFVVELHIPAESLPGLVAETVGSLERTVAAWTTVVADIARHYTDRNQPDRDKPDKPDRDTPGGGGAGPPGRTDLDAHPDERLPCTALRRHVQIRDRTCVGRVGVGRGAATRTTPSPIRRAARLLPLIWDRCAATIMC